MPRVDGTKEKWQDSTSKAMLRGAILRGEITAQTDPKEVYRHVEHQKWKFDAWNQGLTRLLKMVQEDRDRMEHDVLAYGHDLAIVTVERPAEIAWHRSAAPTLLKADVNEGKHKTMPPKQLWLSRPGYQLFELVKFRKHIYQEVDSRSKRKSRFEKKKKRWRYPELHINHPRMQS